MNINDMELVVKNEKKKPDGLMKSTKTTFEFDFKYLCALGFVLPLGAFVSCVLLSIIKDFHSANKTHCGVYNIFPSISASISELYPQNTIWRIAIGIDSFPRYLIAFIYFYKYYSIKIERMKYPRIYLLFIKIAFMFHLIELTSLLILTYVSSVEIFLVHKIGFILFLASSSLYMILTISSYYWPRDVKELEYLENGLTHKENVSKKYKLRVFCFYLLSFLASLYFYIRHNRFCEPLIYSYFSFFEYLTVFANIVYHTIIFYDLNLFDESYKITLIELKQD